VAIPRGDIAREIVSNSKQASLSAAARVSR
jgi:hypothetical protein